MTVRFIHTADIHLDSPLLGLQSFADAPLDSLRKATRRAFEGLIDYAIAEQVDFVVIAGDLFDGSWKDYNTGLFFIAQMAALRKARIRVVLLYGNHDAESEITRASRLRMPDNVYVFDTAVAHTISFDDLKTALHGRSFWQRDVDENLVKGYPEPILGWLNIGVLHTALSGREGHASYAPCSVDDLKSREYQYWALGHVHAGEQLDAAANIVFSGCLQGRHIREPGAHGAFLVTAEDGRIERVSRVCTDVLRWETLSIDVSPCSHIDEILAATESALGLALQRAEGRSLAVRIILRGQTALHGELFGRESHLRAQMQAVSLAFGPGRAWLEKLRLCTEPPTNILEDSSKGDVLSDLRAMLAEAPSDQELLDSLSQEFNELSSKLVPEVRNAAEPLLEQLRTGRVSALVEALAPALLSQVARS